MADVTQPTPASFAADDAALAAAPNKVNPSALTIIPGTVAPEATPAVAPPQGDDISDLASPSPAVASAPEDDISDLATPAPTVGSTLAVEGKSAANAALQSSGMMAGAATGGAIGALVPGLEPVTVPVGAAIGGLTGWWAGRQASSAFGINQDPSELPPNERGAAYTGDFIGGSLGMSAGTVGIAKAGITSSMPFIQSVLSKAGQYPIRFLASEATPAVSGGFAGGAMQDYAPDNAYARVGAQIAAGFFSPVRLLSSVMHYPAEAVMKVWNTISPTGQATAAGQKLKSILQFYANDPTAAGGVADALRDNRQSVLEAGVDGHAGTVAQQLGTGDAGSRAIAILEATLAKADPAFSEARTQAASDALDNYRGVIEHLVATGDTNAVKAAAEARQKYFDTINTAALDGAVAKSQAAAHAMSPEGPAATAELGQRVQELVTGAFEDTKAVENALWADAPKNVPSKAANLIAKFKRLRGEQIAGESTPPLVNGFLHHVMEPENPLSDVAANAALADAGFTNLPDIAASAGEQVFPTNSGELIRFRSLMLSEARKAAAGPTADFVQARYYNELANAALDDIVQLGEDHGIGSIRTALDFTRSMYDAFNRTFAANAMERARNGADRVAPEVLLEKAFGRGGTMANQNMQALYDATAFLDNAGRGTAETAARLPEILAAQRRMLQIAAHDAIDPVTGRPNPRMLENFLQDNAPLLERFPEVRDAIANASRTEQGTRDLVAGMPAEERAQQAQSAFADVAKTDSATFAIDKAINGNQPVTDLQRLANLAKGPDGGPAAITGLRSSLLDWALTKATSGDKLDFGKMDALLNTPLAQGLPSPMQVLREAGIMDSATVGRLTRVLAAGQRVQQAMDAAGTLPGNFSPHNMISTAITRIAGAHFGGEVARHVGLGSSLIAQSTGANLAQKTLEQYGYRSVAHVLMNAVQDPAVFAKLLEPNETAAARIKSLRQLNAYLLQAGIQGSRPTGDDTSNK